MPQESSSGFTPETLYRRGTVMGLTVAEAFMLIAFVLLMLLVFWRYETEESLRLVEEPEIRAIAVAAQSLPLETQQTLVNMVQNPEKDIDEIMDVIEAAKSAPPEARRELVDMIRDPERGVKEITEALELRDELDPHGKEDNDALKKRINRLTHLQDKITEEQQARDDLVKDLNASLGDLVTEVGGRIEDNGTISFPDKIIFDSGQHEIRPRFVQLLNVFCPSWLEELKKSAASREIDDILIEGHSSSEWFSAETPWEAWKLNLELSQRRAQSVLVHCLGLVEQTPLRDWSRAKLAAIGYSSSRPILSGGRENSRMSRRVVFGMRLNREQLLEELGGDTSASR